jgi:chromosome segregation ATPase
MMAELQSCRDAERNLMSALKISESTVIEQESAKASLVAGQERTVKALLNEKAIQQAAIDARDGKIDTLSNQLSELTKRTSLQSEQLGSIESLKNELIQAQRRCSSAEAVIIKMKEKESELSMDLAKAISKSAELEMEIEKKDAGQKKSIADSSKYESENRRLKIERNSLRQRVEGLSKEMSKTNSKSLESEKMKTMIQELRSENRNLLEQIEVIKTEKRDILAKLEATYAAHEQSVRYQRSSSTPTKADNSSCVLEDRVSELESVIASMTDYLSAKDQQISTLKQINEAILKENR